MASQVVRNGTADRDIEQAITALKKGAYLLKYGRRGKPKFCPFRLSNDESILIWLSGKEEKYLRLRNVSKIIPGQRTPNFQRHLRPEKEYQSFSLVSNDGTLDVTCKDKEEAELWFSGLKALISRSHPQQCGSDTRSDGISSGATSPRRHTRQNSPLHPIFDSGDCLRKDLVGQLHLHSAIGSPTKNGLDNGFADVPPKSLFLSESGCGSTHSVSSGGSNGINGRWKPVGVDAFRVSLSSAVSSSSQGSGHDDGDSLGDVYIWGESFRDDHKADYLLPRALESDVVLDVQNIACGGRYAALVTKQGEIFSWGEESGGRLGHGVDSDVLQPKLIDSLSKTNIELISCGEYHTCAVSISGDLYSWGDGTHNYGFLGHANQVSHWVPKRVSGPLDGVHVSYISCGPWHTAVVTSSGQLFTFGDGTFGVLGHGDRRSISQPREVESLKGLRTVRAACGVWHTAAVVEVMVGNSGSSNCSLGKLFTWGDGDKGRLGHGDKEPKLVPTCVASLVEPNFCQVACGHSLTVALSTSGQVYTMGSSVYGQLGNPQASGKLPTLVEGSLSKIFVEEIACGAYHVAVLTSKTEVYTWGKGTNGRLGHGDITDRNSPTLVEALRDKQVKSIACGTNFTAVVCLHKWISGVDQSVCSGCHSSFSFKKKRHNCYHCGLVFCHACSDKKALNASMAPNPKKPHRVCNSCFSKLRKSIEADNSSQYSLSRKGSMIQGTNEPLPKDNKLDLLPHAGLLRFSSLGSMKHLNNAHTKRNKKVDFSSDHMSPILDLGSQWGRLNVSKTFNPMFGTSKKLFSASVPGSKVVSRATSPVSRRLSPPRSATPIPIFDGTLKNIPEKGADLENASLNEEIRMLRAQVTSLNRKAHLQEIELQKTTKELNEAIAVATEETLKCKAAKEVIRSLSSQLKEMAERLPLASSSMSPVLPQNGAITLPDGSFNGCTEGLGTQTVYQELDISSNSQLLYNGNSVSGSNCSEYSKLGDSERITRPGNSMKDGETRRGNEWVKEDEPGVYITLTSFTGGVQELKRVRFSRKRFTEKQAEQWWSENRARVYEQYNILLLDK